MNESETQTVWGVLAIIGLPMLTGSAGALTMLYNHGNRLTADIALLNDTLKNKDERISQITSDHFEASKENVRLLSENEQLRAELAELEKQRDLLREDRDKAHQELADLYLKVEKERAERLAKKEYESDQSSEN